ncbi:MAG: hypothetical protein V5A39_11635 [Haloarculaceae archaeon]
MSGNADEDENGPDQVEHTTEESDGEGGSGKLDAPDWTETHWLESRRAKQLVVFDVILTIIIAAILVLWSRSVLLPVEDIIPMSDNSSALVGGGANTSAVVSGGNAPGPSFEITRGNVLLFTLLGALGYVYTPLFKDIDRSAGEVLELNFRLAGAVPLGFGVFVLSEYLLQNGGVGVLGLAFLAGLYVNAFYERIGAIADYILPSERDTDEN